MAPLNHSSKVRKPLEREGRKSMGAKGYKVHQENKAQSSYELTETKTQ